MSKTILTNAFATYKALCEATNKPIVMDEFVFALVPNQDPNTPISPDELLPDDSYIKGRFKVTQKGMINPDAVVYSIILGTDIGTWDFNWIGLVNSEQNLTGVISHTPVQTKVQVDEINNVAGDTLTRNIITPYTNASVLTEITVTADVWQLDFNNRLTAIDERIRLENIDNYGQAAFIQNAWQATTRDNAITLAPGTAYIAGLQCINKQPLLVDFSGVPLPKKLYLEASFKGTVNSEWQTHTNIVIADSHPSSRIENGVTYYSGEIATITTLSNITDLRTLDWRTSHLKEESDPHPQYVQTSKLDELLKAATTEAPGIIQLATQSEVNLGADAKKAITPSTLKVVTNSLEQKIDHAEEQFKRVATTTQFGLTKLATQQSVDNKTGITEVVTVETLNKPGLIASLQEYATNKANQVKEELLGGLPSATLDTFVEVGNALQQTGDAAAALFTKIGEKLSIVTFDEYKNTVSTALNSKLDKTDKAADSSLLNGESEFYSPRNKPAYGDLNGIIIAKYQIDYDRQDLNLSRNTSLTAVDAGDYYVIHMIILVPDNSHGVTRPIIITNDFFKPTFPVRALVSSQNSSTGANLVTTLTVHPTGVATFGNVTGGMSTGNGLINMQWVKAKG